MHKRFVSLGVSICLDRDSRSQQKKADLDSRENLDTFKILVSTIEKSWPRLRILKVRLDINVQTKKSRSRLRICRDQKISTFLDSFSRSRLRVSQFYHISRSRFLSLSRFLGLMYLKKSQECRDFLTNLAASWQILKKLAASRQILTISICLDNLDKNLDASKSRLKKSWFLKSQARKKKFDLDT